jgi:hypothetical protein
MVKTWLGAAMIGFASHRQASQFLGSSSSNWVAG